MNILLVTSNSKDDKLFTLKQELSQAGYNLTIVLALHYAERILEAQPFDVVLCSLYPQSTTGTQAKPGDIVSLLHDYKIKHPESRCAICSNLKSRLAANLLRRSSMEIPHLPIEFGEVVRFLESGKK